MFGRVAGRVMRRDQRFAERELIAVFHFLLIEAIARAAFVTDKNLGRFDPRAKLARAAHQICVNVCFENMRNGNIFLPRKIEIDFHVNPRIENRGDTLLIVANQIRERGDAFCLHTLKNERHIYSSGGSIFSSSRGTSLFLVMMRAQVFQRSKASSFPGGRIASAFSKQLIASRKAS